MSCLLINATNEPLRIVSLKRAVILVLDEKAEIVEEEPDKQIRSEHTSMPCPKVIKLVRYVQIPFKAKIPLSNRAVLVRDNHVCAYCSKHGSTVDHIQPRSRGGRHEWTNVVCACGPCNRRKGSRTLQEIGWKLDRKPVAPQGVFWLLFGLKERDIDPLWQPYLV